MNKIMLFADSSCDIPPEFIAENNIQIIGFRYTIGDNDGIYTSADQKFIDEFYLKMRKGASTSTSLIRYDDFVAAFEPFFRDGFDIIHIGLSQGLSPTYENAVKAGADLAEKYGRKFSAPDTLCVTAQSYLIIKHAKKFLDENKDDDDQFEKTVDEILRFSKCVKVFFTVEDLKYLHRGGRLRATTKVIGNLLNVKPIITVENGKFASIFKKTGRLASIQHLAGLISKVDPEYLDILVGHADCAPDAELLSQKILEINPDVRIETMHIGCVVGAHGGPGVVGLCFKIPYPEAPLDNLS